MIAQRRTDLGRAAMAGVVAGLAAGTVLTLTMTIVSAVAGHDIWYGMKGAAAPFLGDEAMTPGFSFLPVMLGLSAHYLVSMLWGLGFGLLAYRLDRSSTLVVGGLYGLVVWLGMFYVVLPFVGLSAMTEEAPIVRAAGYHVTFGLALAIALLGFESEEARDRSWAAFGARAAHA